MPFLSVYFPDKQGLVHPRNPLIVPADISEFSTALVGKSFKEGLQGLRCFVKKKGESVPPLINTYINTSSTMKSFGTAKNNEFGNTEETGILITIRDIYKNREARHVASYNSGKQ